MKAQIHPCKCITPLLSGNKGMDMGQSSKIVLFIKTFIGCHDFYLIIMKNKNILFHYRAFTWLKYSSNILIIEKDKRITVIFLLVTLEIF